MNIQYSSMAFIISLFNKYLGHYYVLKLVTNFYAPGADLCVKLGKFLTHTVG